MWIRGGMSLDSGWNEFPTPVLADAFITNPTDGNEHLHEDCPSSTWPGPLRPPVCGSFRDFCSACTIYDSGLKSTRGDTEKHRGRLGSSCRIWKSGFETSTYLSRNSGGWVASAQVPPKSTNFLSPHIHVLPFCLMTSFLLLSFKPRMTKYCTHT